MIKVTKEQLDNKLFEMMHSLLDMYADAIDNNYSAKQIADISTKLLEKTKSEFVKTSDTTDANLNIGVVSNRREQLLSFLEWYRNEQPITCNHKFIIDKYLNLSNCC